jgi:hypothetical protein
MAGLCRIESIAVGDPLIDSDADAAHWLSHMLGPGESDR